MPAGATTVNNAVATRNRSVLAATMVWAPAAVPAGIVTVAWKFPKASAVVSPRLTGALHRPRSIGSLGKKPLPATVVLPPAVTEAGLTVALGDVSAGSVVDVVTSAQSSAGGTVVVVDEVLVVDVLVDDVVVDDVVVDDVLLVGGMVDVVLEVEVLEVEVLEVDEVDDVLVDDVLEVGTPVLTPQTHCPTYASPNPLGPSR